ncbi:MAG: alpha/beta fold hydrolase, partial [Spirochaetes bacterium]|nr:alpha/beta fold hydrolase [Spirochaetota bacterium]
MKKINLENNLFTRKPALPVFLKGGPKAILLLHGYNGYTEDFNYIAKRLHDAGYTVSVPRLAGHGTSANDFLSTNSDMWLRSAIDSYLDLKCSYKNIYICGLSMGGLLALILASLFSIKKIAVMAPALKNRSRNIKFTPFLKFFMKKQKRIWIRTEKNEDD